MRSPNKLSRRAFTTALAAAATLATGHVAKAADAVVSIENFTFAPATLEVAAGTTVTFQNKDDIPHLVVASDNAFRSKALDTDESFRYTFTSPGRHGYFCGLHPHMTGTIVVTK